MPRIVPCFWQMWIHWLPYLLLLFVPGLGEDPGGQPGALTLFPPTKVAYVDATLDHFSFTSKQTFRQKYLVFDKFWTADRSGPILFYFGNEVRAQLLFPFAQPSYYLPLLILCLPSSLLHLLPAACPFRYCCDRNLPSHSTDTLYSEIKCNVWILNLTGVLRLHTFGHVTKAFPRYPEHLNMGLRIASLCPDPIPLQESAL